MKVEFEMEIVGGDRGSEKRVELSVVVGERRRVIFSEYPNPSWHRGAEDAAFSLVASRLENALAELSLVRS